MAIGITVLFTIKEGTNQEFESVITGAAKQVRNEAGCGAYDLYKSVEDDTRYTMVERWENEELLAAHMKAPSMAEMAKIGPASGVRRF